MYRLGTLQDDWRRMASALENVTALATSAATAPVMAYDTTGATAVANDATAASAQRKAVLQELRALTAPTGVKSLVLPVPKAASFAIMQFLVANANNEETTGTLWSWYNFGPAFKQLVLDPIRAGQALMPLDPVTNAPLTNYRWADTLTATVDNCSVEIIEETDGIAQARLDLRGVSDLFFDHDIDLGSGTDGTDCIPFITFFAGESDG